MENVECRPRRVAIAIAIQTEKADRSDARIWLVSSRKHKDRFVLPKGGVEKGEQARQAAARELWEEAGIRTSLALPPWCREESGKTHPDTKPHKLSPTQDYHDASFVPSTLYTVHEFLVTPEQVEEDWLEAHERTLLNELHGAVA
ncbi:diphosphoinositol-polyphosphate diphosphatase [Malassezia psittaci]|uniref:Diphosphoinositol-polyphosphate diphosphatase n=1 Tax=Malassezia psittaci TaxID=1821823 RepID=A0AAF0FH45_9BASI|nr:diphosphoinositol-polyphosphate diphosphatase [Malassezia psittaci]